MTVNYEDKAKDSAEASPASGVPTPEGSNGSVPRKFSTVYALFSIVLLIVIVALGVYTLYQNNKGQAVIEEPTPTIESFRKNYVDGCELKPVTFGFADGASLTGEFAECPADREVTFFATTTILKIPSKNGLKVHHIMVSEKGITYPVVSVYFPYDINADSPLREETLGIKTMGVSAQATSTADLSGTATAVADASSEITIGDIGKSGTIITSASDGTEITWGMAIYHGYVMVLYSKTSGYLFDQNSLKFNDIPN